MTPLPTPSPPGALGEFGKKVGIIATFFPTDLRGRAAGTDDTHPAKRIARLLGLPGTPTRSGWEDEFPGFCQTHHLPAPVMGAPLCGYIVDALFEAEPVIVELDRHDFHLDPIAFETDRERDAETLA